MEYFIAIVMFAISSSVTPGPNNITVMASGVNFGIRKSIPVFMGICVGFAIMLLLVGIGFGQIFEKFLYYTSLSNFLVLYICSILLFL